MYRGAVVGENAAECCVHSSDKMSISLPGDAAVGARQISAITQDASGRPLLDLTMDPVLDREGNLTDTGWNNTSFKDIAIAFNESIGYMYGQQDRLEGEKEAVQAELDRIGPLLVDRDATLVTLNGQLALLQDQMRADADTWRIARDDLGGTIVGLESDIEAIRAEHADEIAGVNREIDRLRAELINAQSDAQIAIRREITTCGAEKQAITTAYEADLATVRGELRETMNSERLAQDAAQQQAQQRQAEYAAIVAERDDAVAEKAVLDSRLAELGAERVRIIRDMEQFPKRRYVP